MLITQESIERVKDQIDIINVISKFVALKKKGQNHQACCPFHNEKTPSFSVSSTKQIYKCFGCGASGDAISFVMEHEKKSYIEAIEFLASEYNVIIDHEEQTPEQKEVVDMLRRQQLLIQASAKKYYQYLLNLDENNKAFQKLIDELIEKRQLDFETVIDWQIGYAPEEWKFLTADIIAKGYYNEGVGLGLIRTKNDNTYDAFRDRIIFPILDHNGHLVGFGGRNLSGSGEMAKYLNSEDSKLYQKRKVLYGLYQARHAIRKVKKALLTEGYYDVISLHQEATREAAKIEINHEHFLQDSDTDENDKKALARQKEEELSQIISNTAIATCGTSLTDEQAKLIRRHTDHIIIFYDGDSAGKAAAWKALDILLKHNFRVEVCWLPEGQDPDSFCRQSPGRVNAYIHDKTNDALESKAAELLSKADTPDDKAKAIAAIATTLSLISNEVKREEYIKLICKKSDLKVKLLQQEVDRIYKEAEKRRIREERKLRPDEEIDFEAMMYEIPRNVKLKYQDIKDEIHCNGFFEYENRYFMIRTPSKEHKKYRFEPVSNFTIKILQHMEDEKIPMKLVEIKNVKGRKRTFDTASENFVSVISFKKMVTGKGNYHWTGTNIDFERLAGKLFDEMGDGRMIRVLGWQEEESIFCFNNGFFNAQFHHYDKHGCFDYHDKSFYVPSANKIYSGHNGKYLNQKRVIYHDNGLRFYDYAKQVKLVHREHGMLGIMFAIICLFSDIIFKKVDSVPMLFLYGEASTGKGNLIKSILSLFGTPQNPLTITGKANTDKAKIRKFAQFVNMIICLEEFSNSVSDDVIQMLKGLWDRYGYERGNLDSDYGTETVPINSGVIMTGNDYPLNDPLVTRLIIDEMIKSDFSIPEKEAYKKLQKIIEAGVSSVTGELLLHRKAIENEFSETFDIVEKALGKILADINLTSRMISNIAVFEAIYKILAERIEFPWTYQELSEYLQFIIIKQNRKRDTGGDVQKFWDCMLYNVRNKRLTNEREFKIEGNELTIQFKEVYLAYSEAHFQLYRTAGLGQSTMHDKLSKWNGYIKAKKSVRFNGLHSSGTVFNYDMCKISLLENIEYLEKQKAKYESVADTDQRKFAFNENQFNI